MQGESLVSQSKWWIELLMEISFSRLSSFKEMKSLFVKYIYIYIFNKFLKFLRNDASILLFLIFILFSISL